MFYDAFRRIAGWTHSTGFQNKPQVAHVVSLHCQAHHLLFKEPDVNENHSEVPRKISVVLGNLWSKAAQQDFNFSVCKSFQTVQVIETQEWAYNCGSERGDQTNRYIRKKRTNVCMVSYREASMGNQRKSRRVFHFLIVSFCRLTCKAPCIYHLSIMGVDYGCCLAQFIKTFP